MCAQPDTRSAFLLVHFLLFLFLQRKSHLHVSSHYSSSNHLLFFNFMFIFAFITFIDSIHIIISYLLLIAVLRCQFMKGMSHLLLSSNYSKSNHLLFVKLMLILAFFKYIESIKNKKPYIFIIKRSSISYNTTCFIIFSVYF